MASVPPSTDPTDSAAIDARRGPQSIAQPKLDAVGWLRFVWRQLTSMRTALVLLLLLAVAAIPGSLVPQRRLDPNGVVQYQREQPRALRGARRARGLQHLHARCGSRRSTCCCSSRSSAASSRAPSTTSTRAARPRRRATPARLERLVGHTERDGDGGCRDRRRRRRARAATPGLPRRALRRLASSAERGYLRETGNLVFHFALIGVLARGRPRRRLRLHRASGSSSRARPFINSLASYDSFNPGRFFDATRARALLDPPRRVRAGLRASTETWRARQASTSRRPSRARSRRRRAAPRHDQGQRAALDRRHAGLPAGQRLRAGGSRCATPTAPSSSPSRCRSCRRTANLTSLGVIKVPDGLDEQLGMRGFFYPTAVDARVGRARPRSTPSPTNPLLTLEVYSGDLGLDDGQATQRLRARHRRAHPDRRARCGRRHASNCARRRRPSCRTGSARSSSRPAALRLARHAPRPVAGVGAAFAALRCSAAAHEPLHPAAADVGEGRAGTGGLTLEYAGLARGEDPTLAAAVAELAEKHSQQLAPKVES